MAGEKQNTLSLMSFFLGWTSVLHSWPPTHPLPWVVQGDGEWGLWSPHNISSATPSSPYFSSCSSVGPSHGLAAWLMPKHELSMAYNLLQGRSTCSSCSDLGAPGLFLTLFSPSVLTCCWSAFCPFLNTFCTGITNWLQGSTLPCGRAIEAVWDQLYLALGTTSLCNTEATPQRLGTYRWYNFTGKMWV